MHEGNGTIPWGTEVFNFTVPWGLDIDGLAMNDTYIWVGHGLSPYVVSKYYHNGTFLGNLTITPIGTITGSYGLTYDDDTAGGPYLWYADSDIAIRQLWVNGTEKFNFTFTHGYMGGLGWDGEHLWTTNNTFVFEFYPNGTEITRWDSGYTDVEGIAYDSDSAGGPYLWINRYIGSAPTDDVVCKFYTNGTEIGSFSVDTNKLADNAWYSPSILRGQHLNFHVHLHLGTHRQCHNRHRGGRFLRAGGRCQHHESVCVQRR